MKFVVVSDTHGTHAGLTMPQGEVLIHCGDALDLGTEEELIRLNNWFKKMRKYSFHEIIYVPGNHDIIIEEDPGFSREILDQATILIDETFIYKGIKIHGSPYVPTFGNWAFMKPDLNLQRHWDNIPDDTDVLITHGPPYGILDKNHIGQCCGSQTLYMAVSKKQPLFHCFGHIHEGAGTYCIDPTTYINAAIITSYWDTTNKIPKEFII